MIEYTSDDLQKCFFSSSHASNSVSLNGELAQDKEQFLKVVEAAIKYPNLRRPDYLRSL